MGGIGGGGGGPELGLAIGIGGGPGGGGGGAEGASELVVIAGSWGGGTVGEFMGDGEAPPISPAAERGRGGPMVPNRIDAS